LTDSATSALLEDDDEETGEDLGGLDDLLLEVLPGDGSTIGNLSAREALSRAAKRLSDQRGGVDDFQTVVALNHRCD